MSTSWKKRVRMLAALLTAATLLACQCAAAFAATAGSPVIDSGKTGTLTVLPEYGGKFVEGCTFSVYKVAEIDRSSTALKYVFNGAFEKAGVDLNAVSSTASAMLNAAKTLAKYADNEKLNAVKLAADQTKLSNLTLGVYLVVQTGAPKKYIAAVPFLVYVPVTNDAGTGWLYDITAQPKLGYNDSGIVTGGLTASVTKTWEDEENENRRPTSVTVTLLRDDKAFGEPVTLSAQNNWSYSWKDLDPDSVWKISESIPDGYTNLIDITGPENNAITFDVTNTYEVVPLSDVISVTKVWKDLGHEEKRPQSVKVGLYLGNELKQTAVLNELNKWSAVWPVEKAEGYTVKELDTVSGYTSEVTNSGTNFTITNTYKEELTPIPDEDVPKAPQTGLVQWPVPVLLALGSLMIVAGYLTERKNAKKYEG